MCDVSDSHVHECMHKTTPRDRRVHLKMSPQIHRPLFLLLPLSSYRLHLATAPALPRRHAYARALPRAGACAHARAAPVPHALVHFLFQKSSSFSCQHQHRLRGHHGSQSFSPPRFVCFRVSPFSPPHHRLNLQEVHTHSKL